MPPENADQGLLTRTEAANLAGVAVCTISNWVARGHLKQATNDNDEPITDHKGRPLYWMLDVARTERATRNRDRARRLHPRAA